MKHSEVMADQLILAGYQPGIDFVRYDGGIYMTGDAVNYLVETLHPEMVEDIHARIKEQPFGIEDLPKAPQ